MGPPPQSKPFPVQQHYGNEFNQHHHEQQSEPDIEVKKIYLLKPIPKAQPQPQLKGGGFMGAPVQNHIHVQTGSDGAMKFGRSVGKRPSHFVNEDFYHHGQHHHHQQTSDEIKPATKGGSEVKILPIVMIPPVAPVPTLHLSTGMNSNMPRMSLTPQFNNYVMASERRGRTPSSRDEGHHSELGGGRGASLFRDNYAARSKALRSRQLPGRSSATSASEHHGPGHHYDYPEIGDYDYDAGDYGQGVAARRRRLMRSHSSRLRPRNRPDSAGNHHRSSVNSIRDILQARGTQQPEDSYGRGLADYDHDYHNAADESLDLVGRRFRQIQGPSSEISLDEFGLQAERGQQHLANGQHWAGHSSNSPYRENNDIYDLIPTTRMHRHRSDELARWSKHGPASRDYDEVGDSNNLLNEDEWRFESAKSVSHVEPAQSNSTYSTVTEKGELQDFHTPRLAETPMVVPNNGSAVKEEPESSCKSLESSNGCVTNSSALFNITDGI